MILLTGGAGFIGKKWTLENTLKVDLTTNENCIECDLCDSEKVADLFRKNDIKTIVHLAAIKDLATCESNESLVRKTNVGSTLGLLELAKKYHCHFIFISSDIVFNGASGNYSESSETSPINNYGKFKVECEEEVSRYEKGTIVRTAMVFGRTNISEAEKNSSDIIVQGHVVEQIISRLTDNKGIRLSKKEIINPTLDSTLIKQLEIIIHSKIYGVLHCCGSESISKFDFGVKIAKHFGLNSDLITESAEINPLRPLNVSLVSKVSQERLGFDYPDVEEMLNEI